MSLWSLLAAGTIIFLGFLSRLVISGLFKGMLKKHAERSAAEWDDEAVERLPAPLAAIVQIFVWYLALLILRLPTEPVDIEKYVYKGLEAALAVSFVWLLLRIIDVFSNAFMRASAETETKLDDQLIPLLRKTLKTLVAILAIVQIIQNLGYSVTSLIAGLGVGGLALALAAQDTVANVFGSIVIFADKPFQVGDWIESNGVEGTVEEVGFRTTRVRRFDKSLVVMPNSTFSDNPITNHSSRPIRRVTMTVGLSYDTTPDQMNQFLSSVRELLQSHEGIDQGFHFAHFTEFNESTLDVQIYCFTKTTNWVEHLRIREDLQLRIMKIVEDQKLEIAFRTQTLHIKQDKGAS